MLLKTHLDTFQSRHSFQLRQWQLKRQEKENDLHTSKADEINDNTAKFLSHHKLLEQINIANNQPFNALFKQINTVVNTLAKKPGLEEKTNKDK